MLHAVSLGAFLYVLWLLLSGLGAPLLLGLGAASACLVVFIAHRMDVIDHEGHPIHLRWRMIAYWPWLLRQIVMSNLHVARVILDPRLPIKPKVVHFKGTQKSELGNVIYANSITLTPGTVTISLEDGNFGVHALTAKTVGDLQTGEMDRRVTSMEIGAPNERNAAPRDKT